MKPKNIPFPAKAWIKEAGIAAVQSIDKALSSTFLRFFPEKCSLLTFLFHGLFLNEEEINRHFVNPQQGITIRHFRLFIEYYLNNGYVFISPEDILQGLDPGKKYILITFDDGYFNNYHALPILKEFKVPAVFFISTSQILQNKCFWWDVLYRELVKSDARATDLAFEEKMLKKKTADEIEKYIVEKFGEASIKPICDIDRPFTPDELRNFASDQFVFIGNHTCDHAILTNYSLSSAREQILNAQYDLCEITGKRPVIISYPNGNYSNEIIRISKELGFMLGITTEAKKNYLPLSIKSTDSVRLGRFVLLGNKEIHRQCEVFRSDIALYNKIKNMLKKR